MKVSGAETVVAVDVGGTKVEVGSFAVDGDGLPRILASVRYPSADYGDLESLLTQYFSGCDVAPAALAIAVAGPVRSGTVRTTNLPWFLSSERLTQQFGGIPVYLLNDLEAAAIGVLALPDAAFAPIVSGVPVQSHRGILAPGTGLGQSLLYWDGSNYRPWATEGGHVGFAPRDDEQIELLRYLRRREAQVSYEHVLSGPGLANLFDFLTSTGSCAGRLEFPAGATPSDRGAAIGRAAVEGTCAASRASVRLFFRILAARTGDLALSAMALGGVEIAGGVVPRLLPLLDGSGFAATAAGAGPFAEMLSQVPVRVVLEPRVALIGAARTALRGLAIGTHGA